MAMAFSIEDRVVDGDTHVVAVTGEIDLFTAPEFKQRVSAPIDAGRTHVVVDLTETTFIDSSSLGVLIGAHRRLRRLEGVAGDRVLQRRDRQDVPDHRARQRLHDRLDARRSLQRQRGRRLASVGSRMSTGSPSQDAQHDFSRARRARLLADVARRLRGEPDDVAMILPFEEVVDALGRVGQVDRGLKVVAARRHRRDGRPRRRLRPRLPPHHAAAALALGADRGRAAARRGDAAGLALQGRRPLLRARRAPPRVGGQVPRARRHRRLRHRGHDQAEALARPARLRAAAQGPRAAVPRAGAA